MNRAERRKQEKQQDKPVSKKKLTEWVNKLTKEQQKMIAQYADGISERNFNRMTHSLDNNFTAAMILKTELSITQIDNIFEDVFQLMKDDREKDTDNKRNFKNEGEYLEFMKNIEKMVTQRAIELLEKGMKEKEVREKLFLEYPALSKSKITNCVKKVKEIMEDDKETQNAAIKMLDIIDNPVVKKEVQEVSTKKTTKKTTKKVEKKPVEKVEVKEIKVEKVQEVKGEVKKDKPLSGLRVKKVEVIGRFSAYSVENKRVKLELNRSFDKKSWEDFKEEMEEIFTKYM